jgi:hypothetical protein
MRRGPWKTLRCSEHAGLRDRPALLAPLGCRSSHDLLPGPTALCTIEFPSTPDFRHCSFSLCQTSKSSAVELFTVMSMSLPRDCHKSQHLQTCVRFSQCRAEKGLVRGFSLRIRCVRIFGGISQKYRCIRPSPVSRHPPVILHIQAPSSVPSILTGPPYPETPDRRYQAELEYQDSMPPRTFRQRNYPFSCQWWDIYPGRLEKLGMQAAQARTP